MCFQLFLFLKNILIKQRILYDFYGTTRNKLNMQALHLLLLFFYFIYFPSHRKNNNNTNWLYVIRVFFFSIHSLYPGGLLHFVIYIEIKKNKLNDAYAHICLLVVGVLPFSSSLFGIHPFFVKLCSCIQVYGTYMLEKRKKTKVYWQG